MPNSKILFDQSKNNSPYKGQCLGDIPAFRYCFDGKGLDENLREALYEHCEDDSTWFGLISNGKDPIIDAMQDYPEFSVDGMTIDNGMMELDDLSISALIEEGESVFNESDSITNDRHLIKMDFNALSEKQRYIVADHILSQRDAYQFFEEFVGVKEFVGIYIGQGHLHISHFNQINSYVEEALFQSQIAEMHFESLLMNQFAEERKARREADAFVPDQSSQKRLGVRKASLFEVGRKWFTGNRQAETHCTKPKKPRDLYGKGIRRNKRLSIAIA